MGRIKQKSFTLIELVIAVGIIALILPPIFNIFFIIIRQQLVIVAYQEIIHQGDSAQRNIKNIIQNRAAYVTDSTYDAVIECPLPLTPTPTYAPNLYLAERDGKFIHLYQKTVSGIDTIASDSVRIDKSLIKSYNLTSGEIIGAQQLGVAITDVGFSCSKINDFTPPIISAHFTVVKTTMSRDTNIPYNFKMRLRNY